MRTTLNLRAGSLAGAELCENVGQWCGLASIALRDREQHLLGVDTRLEGLISSKTRSLSGSSDQ